MPVLLLDEIEVVELVVHRNPQLVEVDVLEETLVVLVVDVVEVVLVVPIGIVKLFEIAFETRFPLMYAAM